MLLTKNCQEKYKDYTKTDNCLDSIYNARYNALLMLKNRGFIVPESYFVIDRDRLSFLYNIFLEEGKKPCNIMDIKIYSNNCYAKIVWIKDKIKDIEDKSFHVKNFKTDIGNYRKSSTILDNDNLIMILVENKHLKPSDYFYSGRNIENNFVSYFSLSQLQINILNHNLVPKHILLTPIEKSKILKNNKNKLPLIIRYANITDGPEVLGDPVARYLGLKHGDVVKIIRKSPNAGITVNYRQVLDDSNSNDTEFILGEIDGNSSYILYLENIFYKNSKNNLSLFGNSFEKICQELKFFILKNDNKNDNKLNYFSLQLSGYYQIILNLENIRANFKTKGKFSKNEKQFIKNNFNRFNFKNIDKEINNKNKEIVDQVFKKFCRFMVNLLSLYYLNLNLPIIIDKRIKILLNNLKNKESLDEIYNNIYNIINPFLGNLKASNIINNLIILTPLPRNRSDLENLSDKFFICRQVSESSPDYSDWLNNIENIPNEEQLKIDNNLSDIENKNLQEYLKFLDQIQTHISKSKPLESVPGLNKIFVSLRDVMLIQDTTSLDSDIKIDNIWNILENNILENNIPKNKEILKKLLYIYRNLYFTLTNDYYIIYNFIILFLYSDILNESISNTLINIQSFPEDTNRLIDEKFKLETNIENIDFQNSNFTINNTNLVQLVETIKNLKL